MYRVVSRLIPRTANARNRSIFEGNGRPIDRKCREEISREESSNRVVSLSLSLSLSCLPEIRISFGRKPIARNPSSRPGEDLSQVDTHTRAYIRAHIFTRDSFERSDRVFPFFFFFLTWRSSLLQQVSTTIDFLTTLDNVSKGANGEKEREYRSETERGKYRSFHLPVEIESKVIIVTSFF